MAHLLDTKRLATMVRAKRAERGLREVAAEIGNVSPSTLSRVENGKMPDMETFLVLCNWIDVPPATFFVTTNAQTSQPDEPDALTIQLRASKHLDPATADALAALVETLTREQAAHSGLEQVK